MFSFLFTTRNRPELMIKQVEYIDFNLKNSAFKYEVIVYDDCSDGSEYPDFSDYSHVKFIKGESRIGLIGARNILAENSSKESEYLVFLDDDIFVFNLALMLNDCFDLLKKDSSISVYTVPFINLPLDKSVGVKSFDYLIDFNKNSKFVNFFFGGCSIIRKSTFIELNGFEDKFFFSLEEEDFSIRLMKNNKRCYLSDSVNIVGVHDQPPNKSWSDRYVYLLSNRLLFLKKHVSLSVVRLFLSLLYISLYFIKSKNINIILKSIKRYNKHKKDFMLETKFSCFFKYFLARLFHV